MEIPVYDLNDGTELPVVGFGTVGLLGTDGLEAIQSAIDGVSANRGDLGAYFNRLDHTISVITTQAENLKAAESQIRDANVAEEVVNITKFQVLNQTGLAALAQANATSQSILSLLQ